MSLCALSICAALCYTAGVAAVYLTEHSGSGPAQVAAAIVSGATLNNITSSALLPGTPNRLLFSATGVTGGGQVQAASGP